LIFVIIVQPYWELLSPVAFKELVEVGMKVVKRLTLWGLRCFWVPWDVLTCPNICVYFSCL